MFYLSIAFFGAWTQLLGLLSLIMIKLKIKNWVFIVYFFKKQSYLFVLMITLVNPVFSSQIYQICENDILLAKQDLEKTEYQNKIARRVAVAAGIGLTCFVLYKTGKDISSYLDQRKIDKINNAQAATAAVRSKVVTPVLDLPGVEKEFKQLPAIDLDLKLNAADKRLADLEKLVKGDTSTFGYIKNIGAMVAMNIGPMIAGSLLQSVFSEQTITNLTKHRLAIPQRFQRLKIAQLHLAPAEFAKNVHFKNDPEMVLFARELSFKYANMPKDQLAELQNQAQDLLVEGCNEIVKKMCYVIAFMRYMAKNEHSAKLINSCAEQLYLATYEFSNKLQASLDSANSAELFNEIALFHSAYNVAVNNFMLLS